MEPTAPLVYAHRGATAEATENTIEAFLDARRIGADGVELDVRLSKDEALVVHHDPVIPGLGAICDLGVPDLPPQIPLLAEALEACEGMVVNVEVKNLPGEPGFDPDDAVAALVAQVIVEAECLDRVIVSSFNPATIDAVRIAEAQIPVGWLLRLSADPAESLTQAIAADYQAIHPFVTQVSPELVAQAHRHGLAVNVWTVNADDDLSRMVEVGVDGLVTDRLREALQLIRA